MIGPASAETLRSEAITLERHGDWPALDTFLGERAAELQAHPDLIALRGEALLRGGRMRDARNWLAAGIKAIEKRGDHVVHRRAINLLGAAHLELGELEPARLAFDRAIELGREEGDDLLVARATNNLGIIANIQGEQEGALALYALAVASYQRLGHAHGLAESHHNMGVSFRHLGDLDRADECERRAIDFAREAGSVRLAALARLGRAEISLARGDAMLAVATALRVAKEFAAIHDPIQQAGALRVVGIARTVAGWFATALVALNESLDLARLHGSALDEAETLRALANLALATDDRCDARTHARHAIVIFERLGASKDRDLLSAWLAAVERGAASEV